MRFIGWVIGGILRFLGISAILLGLIFVILAALDVEGSPDGPFLLRIGPGLLQIGLGLIFDEAGRVLIKGRRKAQAQLQGEVPEPEKKKSGRLKAGSVILLAGLALLGGYAALDRAPEKDRASGEAQKVSSVPRSCGWETDSGVDPITDARISKAFIRSDNCRQDGVSLSVSCKNGGEVGIEMIWPAPVVDILNAHSNPNGKAARVTVRFGQYEPFDIGMGLSATLRNTVQLSAWGETVVGLNAGVGSMFGGAPLVADWSGKKFAEYLAAVDKLALRTEGYNGSMITGSFDVSVRKDQYLSALKRCLK